MTVTGRNDDVSILLPVDDAVGVVDTPTPPSAQISLQRLGLADALIGVPLNVFYEGVDSLQQLFVPASAKTIIFHASSSQAASSVHLDQRDTNFAKIVKAVVIESPISAQTSSMLRLRSGSIRKFTLTAFAILMQDALNSIILDNDKCNDLSLQNMYQYYRRLTSQKNDLYLNILCGDVCLTHKREI